MAALILAGVLAAAQPAGRSRLVAASALAEGLGGKPPRPFAPDIEVTDTRLGTVEGRLFTPDPARPAILAVPGATPAGVEDTRVNRVAASLARSNRQVFIPRLELYEERFSTSDIQRIVEAALALYERSGRPVTLLGFSYGGSFALIAAADPRLEGRVKVGTFGAYFDLVGLLQAVTTGVSLVDGRTVPWQGHPLARDVLYARAAELVPPSERTSLVDALGGKGDPDRLSSPTRALYDLLTNRDPARTYELASRLPEQVRELLRGFSPAAVADRITAPVYAVHSTDDPLVPYGELARLEAAMPRARTSTVSVFRHVDFDPSSVREWGALIPDLAKMWWFAGWILEG